MSFQSKLKTIDPSTKLSSNPPAGCSYGSSFNDSTIHDLKTKDLNIKTIIVGTYTPFEGRTNGYFYCSQKNHMYEYLSYALNEKNLLTNKRKTYNEEDRENGIEGIKKILYKHGIAFFDVVKEAISPKDNASDDAIIDFTLDYSNFEELMKCIDSEKVKFIANSHSAEKALTKISVDSEKHIKNQTYCSQSGRCSGGIEGRKSEWKKQLSN